jgi:hypothetical protein
MPFLVPSPCNLYSSPCKEPEATLLKSIEGGELLSISRLCNAPTHILSIVLRTGGLYRVLATILCPLGLPSKCEILLETVSELVGFEAYKALPSRLEGAFVRYMGTFVLMEYHRGDDVGA